MSREVRLARWACGAAALVVAAVLAWAGKPWECPMPAAGGKPGDFAAWYGWWAGLANALALVVLGLTAGFWARPVRPPDQRLPGVRTPVWFWPGVVLAVVLLAGFAAPRMGQSLWDDEENSVRRLIAGKMVPAAEGGGLRLRKATWEQAVWSYNRPTNHHLQTWLSKLCHEGWRKAVRAGPPHFREWVVRIPALIAGLLAVAALAALLKRLGFPLAGVVAALLLAMHPWFIRYASEARGYTLTILFSLTALRCAIEGLESGSWRWWAGYGGSLFGMLAAFPAMAVVAAALSVVVAAALVLRHGVAGCAPYAARWFVASTVAAMAFFQLMLPCAPQMDPHVHESLAAAMNARWERNLGSLFLCGMPWNNSDDPLAGYPELRWTAERSPRLFVSTVCIAAGFAAWGLGRLALKWPGGWLCLATWLFSPALLFLAAKKANLYLYEWYLLFALPGAAALAALGVEGLAVIAGRLWKPAAAAVVVLACLVAWAGQSQARQRLLESPLQGMRDAVVCMRGGLDPHSSADVLTGQVAVRLELYDPRIRHVRSLDDLHELARQAESRGVPLLVTAGNPWAVAAEMPDLAKILEDPAVFAREAYFQGFDPTLDQRVVRYRRGSLGRTDAEERR